MKKILSFLIVIIAVGVNAQQFPQDFNYSTFTEVLLDAGLQWEMNSSFHPFCTDHFNFSEDRSCKSFGWMNSYLEEHVDDVSSMERGSKNGLGVILMPGMGISYSDGDGSLFDDVAFTPYLWSEMEFHDRFYAQIYFRGTNEPESLPHFSATVENQESNGLRYFEVDQAVIGFRNDWMNIEYGRSREIWGQFTEDNMLLAGNSPSYERLMGQVNYKRFSARWFFGSLNSEKWEYGENINRYISGRTLEYNNRYNLIVSAGEVSMFSGPNRGIDFALVNPLAFPYEIEENDRENDVSGNHSNIIWILNADYLLLRNLRLMGSLMIDDLQLDPKERDDDDADELGYLFKFAWTPMYEPVGFTVFGYGQRIDTYAMIHSYGYSNLVNRGEPIGSSLGNDADDIGLGVRCIFPWNFALEVSRGEKRWGGNSLLFDPYVSYPFAQDGPFPSGEVRMNSYLKARVFIYPYENVLINLGAHFDLINSGTGSEQENYYFSVSYQLPIILNNL